MKNQNIKTIGIFGHYGNLNLGDEAIITALIENINQRFTDVQLYCFSINPQETESRYGIPTFPIRRLAPESGQQASMSQADEQSIPTAENTASPDKPTSAKTRIVRVIKSIPGLAASMRFIRALPEFIADIPGELAFNKKSYDALKSIDLLIIAGSNQFLDNFGGPWGFPFTLLRWSILARLAKVKISYVSVGAGPLEAKLSVFMCRFALSFSHYASFRDRASQLMIARRSENGKTSVYPDLAFSLLNYKATINGQCDQKLKVGINVMAMYDPRYWCEPDQQKYTTYIEKLAIFAHSLLQNNYDIFFFGTQKKDEAVIVDVLDALSKRTQNTMRIEDYAKYSETVYGLLEVIAEADIVIATRFHGTVLSLFSNKPTLGVCYYRKSADLLRDMGQGDYYVDIDDFNPDILLSKFYQMVENKSHQAAKIKNANKDYKQQLGRQYDNILQL